MIIPNLVANSNSMKSILGILLVAFSLNSCMLGVSGNGKVKEVKWSRINEEGKKTERKQARQGGRRMKKKKRSKGRVKR